MRPAFSSRRPHLQFILDGSAAGVTRAAELARAAAEGGVDSIQIRAKGMGAGELLERVLAVIEAVRAEHPGVLVLVNERADVALLAGADGVHLPEASFGPAWAAELKRLAASAPSRQGSHPARQGSDPDRVRDQCASFVVGRSIHGLAGLAAPGTGRLDYLMFGHVFTTESKPGLPPRGIDSLARIARSAPVPVLAVGGITVERAAAAVEAGAAGVAVISAIRDAPDPVEAVRALRRAIDHVTGEGEVPCA